MGLYRCTPHIKNHWTECDMGWYRYTSHNKNHCTGCDMGWYRYTSLSENHCTECDIGWYWYMSHILKTIAQSVIWADTDIRLIVGTRAKSVRNQHLSNILNYWERWSWAMSCPPCAADHRQMSCLISSGPDRHSAQRSNSKVKLICRPVRLTGIIQTIPENTGFWNNVGLSWTSVEDGGQR